MRRLLLPLLTLSVLAWAVPAAAKPPGARGAPGVPGAPVVSATVVQAAPDHFVESFGDPVDYANAEDQLLVPPATQNAAPRLEAGELRWERTATMDVAVVFAGYAPSAFAAGREGIAAPVDADRYRFASFRLYSASRTAASVFFDACGPDRGRCGGSSPTFVVEPGWHTYDLALPWSGSIVEVRLSVAGDGTPTATALDWFRLHGPGPGVEVSYQGGALYWDGDDDRSNNIPDQPNWGVVASGGGTATFPAAAYPDGTYRFFSDGGPSSAPVVVGAPVTVFDEPDVRGGADHAVTVRGDAWDFAGPGDVAVLGNATDVSYDGGVLRATNTSNDPFVELPVGPPIDTARFTRLTVRTTLDGPFDLGLGPGGGSHGRLLWGSPERLYDSRELVVYPGVTEYTVDLALDASDTDVAERPGWTGIVPRLRYDPNEDPGPRRWSIDEISLRADDETVDDAFSVVYRDVGVLPADSVALYADTDRAGFDGRLIAEGLPASGSYRWDTREWPAGRYHLYAAAERDGTVGRRYAGGPVVVSPRLGGADRFATAVRLSRAAFPDSAPAVVVASGTDFPDALAAAPLAAAAGGPLLLNPPDRLAPEVAAEVERLGAARVYLLGGPAAQSAAVEAALAALPGVEVVRVAGANRYATAAAAAQLAAALWGEGPVPGVLVASGADFPDALAAAPLAAATRAPLLLTAPDGVPADTAGALEALGAPAVTVVGGPAAVSDATLAQLGTARRIGGPNRSATAVLLAEEAVRAGASADDVLAAAARQFPDALAAGAVSAARGGVLLLSERDALPPETAAFLRTRAPTLTWLRVAGGPAALADQTVRDLLTAAGR